MPYLIGVFSFISVIIRELHSNNLVHFVFAISFSGSILNSFEQNQPTNVTPRNNTAIFSTEETNIIKNIQQEQLQRVPYIIQVFILRKAFKLPAYP